MKKFVLYIIMCVLAAGGAQAERLFMVGDSHVAGKVYPQTVDSLLTCKIDSCRFSYFGINGASFATFCKPENLDTIFSAAPEILIVHLGTNDSYSRRFNRETFLSNMTQFYNLVHDSLPQVKMVFVTPFVNKLKHTTRTKAKKKKRRRTHTVWEINNNTIACSDIIVKFCEQHPDDTRVINHNATHGEEFLTNGLINPRDFVHLTKPGYALLGTQIAEELLNIPDFFSSSIEE